MYSGFFWFVDMFAEVKLTNKSYFDDIRMIFLNQFRPSSKDNLYKNVYCISALSSKSNYFSVVEDFIFFNTFKPKFIIKESFSLHPKCGEDKEIYVVI